MNNQRVWLYATLTLLLGGCSGNLALPWESNLLDPSRVATREPLEIPPDLHTLPPVEGTGKDRGGASLPWTDPSLARQSSGQSGGRQAIRLPGPVLENKDDPSLSRNQQEKLPAWMEQDRVKSK